MSLRDPKVIQSDVPLSSKRVPLLCLLDALQAAGYVPVQRRVEHKPGGEAIFDGRASSQKRSYLQCVLSRLEIFERGQQGFHSTEATPFYDALLSGHVGISPGLGVADIRRLIAGLPGGGGEPESEVLRMPAPAPRDRAEQAA